MANLRDNILVEMKNREIPEIFNASNFFKESEISVKIGEQTYSKKSFGEILANHSIGPLGRMGQSVKTGGEMLFVKHETRGMYSIFNDDDGEDNGGVVDVESVGDIEIANKFVDYIRNKPFRIMRYIGRGEPTWYPAEAPTTGWLNRLNHYDWKGSDWISTQQTLAIFEQRLTKLEQRKNVEDAQSIYNDIKEWGNPRGSNKTGQQVLTFLDLLWDEGNIKQVDSTLTKLYALARPDDFVIYDSRVATAIVGIAEDIYRYRTVSQKQSSSRADTVNIVFRARFPSLGIYNSGAGGSRPRGFRFRNWPDAYRSIGAQLEANRLCKAIVSCLNANRECGKNDWTLREVEAVLFMEGY